MRGLFANSNMSRRETQAAGGSIRRRLLFAPRRRPAFLSDGFIPTPPSLSRERRMYHSSLYALGLIAIAVEENRESAIFSAKRRERETRGARGPSRRLPNMDFGESPTRLGEWQALRAKT